MRSAPGRLMRWAAWLALSVALVAATRSAHAQGARGGAVARVDTTFELVAQPGDLPRYVCLLMRRQPDPGEPVLCEGWQAQLQRRLREIARHPTCLSEDRECPPGPRDELLVGAEGAEDERHAMAALLSPGIEARGVALPASCLPQVEVSRPVVAQASQPARPGAVNAPSRCEAPGAPASTTSSPSPTVVRCFPNLREDLAVNRVLLLSMDIPYEAVRWDHTSLFGNIFSLTHAPAQHNDLSVTPVGGHYLVGTTVSVDRQHVTLPLQPVCVVRELPVPPSGRQDDPPRVVTVGLEAGAPAEPVSPPYRVALPTQQPGATRPRRLAVTLLRRDAVVGVLGASWTEPVPPVAIALRVKTLTFSWWNDREYPPDSVCPTAWLDALNLQCDGPSEGGSAHERPCTYVCRVARTEADAEVHLPLRVRFRSDRTGDQWYDDVELLEQSLDAAPDPETRHLVADLSRWPRDMQEDAEEGGEVHEINIISETDQVFHLYPPQERAPADAGQPRRQWRREALVTVPGARRGTPLRLRPFGSQAFHASPPLPVSQGVIAVPDPSSLVHRWRFGVRLGAETLGPFDDAIPWKVGVHAQATVRWMPPALRVGGRFIPVEFSFHYTLMPLPYHPLHTAAFARNASTEADWYNRAGISIAVPFPLARRFYLGPMVTWYGAWPLVEQERSVGGLALFFSLAAAFRFNINVDWSLEWELGLQTLPAPQFTGGDFSGSPHVDPNWLLGAVGRLALRYWF
ncbi:MAG: hypothetical protein U0326_42565 [Polyangiales bacterium]